MQGAQAAFEKIRFSAVTHLTFLLRILPLNVTHGAAEEYDALLQWVLASVVAGEGVGAAGLAS